MKNKIFVSFCFFILCSFSTVEAADGILKKGVWQTIDYQASGGWLIVEENNKMYVVLGPQFKTTYGPDLHILLSKKPLQQLTNSNANRSSTTVGLLETTKEGFSSVIKGPQKLLIPKNIDIEDYNSIIIHCVRFSHLWAGSAL